MFLAADGQDGNGLQLEQVAPTFSTCIVASQQNRLLWFTLPSKIRLKSSPLCTREEHFVREEE